MFKCNSQLHSQPSVALLSKHGPGMFERRRNAAVSRFNRHLEISVQTMQSERRRGFLTFKDPV